MYVALCGRYRLHRARSRCRLLFSRRERVLFASLRTGRVDGSLAQVPRPTRFACASLDDGGAFCLPLCRADVECGPDRFCNRASGLCEQTKPVGDPVGATCDPTATTTGCRETCLRTSEDGVTPITGVCVELCSGALECMWDDAGTKPGGFCAGRLSEAFGPFDLGFCYPTCDCSGECPTFGAKCRAWPSADAEIKNILGKPGLCYETTEGTTELTCK